MTVEQIRSNRRPFFVLIILAIKSKFLLFNRRIRIFIEPLLQPLFPRWSALRNRARVQKVDCVKDEFVNLTLKTPHGWGGFHPGQHVQLGVTKNGARLQRTFSISSGVQSFRDNRTIGLTIQVQKKGNVTPWIYGFLKSGETVSLSKAAGDFIIDPTRPALLIAGGSGVTPFHSFLKGELSKPAVLLHYSKNPGLFSEVNVSENASVHHLNTTQRGRFSKADLETLCPNFRQFEIYICGPGKMIQDVRNLLMTSGCSSDQIHSEYFGAPPTNIDLKIGNKVPVYFSKSERNTVGDKRNLLELAESTGLNPVFGCRMGVCHQCKCPKKQGVVFNTRTQQYSDAGPEDIQLCVSVPVNDVVIDL